MQQHQLSNNNNNNNNNMYQSPPIQIQQQQPQQQSSSYAITPPNSNNIMNTNYMNSSSFSPNTNTYFSPSFTAAGGYFTPSPQIRPQQQPQPQPQMQMPQMQMPQIQMPQIQMPLQMPLQYQNNMSAGVTAVLGQSMKTYKIYRPYFQLEIYVPKPILTSTSSAGAFASASAANNLRTLYESMISEHNKVTLPLIVGSPGECNAGFDLLTPTTMCATGYNTVKIDHLVKCRMSKIFPHSSHSVNVFQDSNGILRQYNTTILPVGFYLYPRSSTGTKTPLRLANSVGIIDSGYRGPLIAAFDNWKKDDFEIQENQRLVQICAPDLSYPIYVILVDTEEELGKTNRGSGGFGSTG